MDPAGQHGMSLAARFTEAALGGPGGAVGTAHECQGVASTSNSPIEVHPATPHFAVGFIYAPGIISRLERRTDTLCKLRGVALDPAIAGRLVDLPAPLRHVLRTATRSLLPGRGSSDRSVSTSEHNVG